MKKCIYCGQPALSGMLCRKCKHKVPSGYSLNNRPENIYAEIYRNEKIKEMFQKTTELGKLQLDTCRNLFHIDNAYYKVTDVSEYSFYWGEPRYGYGFGSPKVYADIYFSFRIMNEERRVRKLITLPCRNVNTGRAVHVEPPLAMLSVRETFAQMIENSEKRDWRK